MGRLPPKIQKGDAWAVSAGAARHYVQEEQASPDAANEEQASPDAADERHISEEQASSDAAYERPY
jgi:hypothetical protein